MANNITLKKGHPAADALDWNEAMRVIHCLDEDERYRDSMMIALGCYLGIRISDILRLRWKDILNEPVIEITEKKTSKARKLKVNPELLNHAKHCHEEMCIENDNSYILASTQYGGSVPITRGRADQILKDCKKRYDIKSAKVFSSHSLRKTFGRRVWLQECKKKRGDQALILLQDVFGHSSIAITKRYLGIRQEEILSVYDSLSL